MLLAKSDLFIVPPCFPACRVPSWIDRGTKRKQRVAPDRNRTCDLQGLGIPSSILLSYEGLTQRVQSAHRTQRSIFNQGMAWRLAKFILTLEKRQLDNSTYLLDVSPRLLDQGDGRSGGPTGRDQVVENTTLSFGPQASW